MLEQKEMDLIQKLQHTQSLQKEAFEELEKVLSSGPGEISPIKPPPMKKKAPVKK